MKLDDRPASGVAMSGMTVIEVLLVGVLLLLVAVTLLPQFAAAEHDARQKAVLQDLHMFRRQIAQYREHHDGRLPAEGTNSAEAFQQALCKRTTHTGAVDESGRHGPYLIGGLPENPYTHRSTVIVVPGDLQPHHYDGELDYGWAYSSISGDFRANVSPTVVDPNGVPVNQL